MEPELPYTEEDLDHLKKIFSLFDKEGVGMIEIDDMRDLMGRLNKTQAEADALVHEVDVNHDDYITFEEFVHLLSKIESSLESRNPLAEIAGHGLTEDSEMDETDKVFEFLGTLERHRRKCE
jgi:Ca2+-binding EF-hand superfamily protein